MQKHLLLSLGIGLLLQAFPLKGQNFDCAYPIIFLHGWTGNQNSFSAVYNHPSFVAAYGPLSDQFHAVVNATTATHIWGNDQTPNTPDDDVLVQFGNETNDLLPGCVYAINFENFWNEDPGNPILYQNSGDTPNLFESDSNESAILKQGYALGEMIQKVLAANPDKEKVILVGHSMGGLAAREYLQRRSPETPGGTPRWWVNPGSPNGHQVAKLVTTVTPHRGSNTLGNLLPEPDDPTRDALPDLASEAVRDLRYSYACGFFLLDDCPGVYLFGGDEDDFEVFPYPYWNEDVDCDGDESSPNVVGINISGLVQGTGEEWDGTYDNPNLPLPTNIRYTWITSDIPVDNGDGVVAWSRQWLYNGSSPAPSDGTAYRLTDTLFTNYFHTSVNGDVNTVIRGLDEGDYPAFAWQLLPDNPSGGFANRRSLQSPEGPATSDPDWFVFQLPASANNGVILDLTPHPGLAGRIDFFTTAPGGYTQMTTLGAYSQSFSAGSGAFSLLIPAAALNPGGTYYFRVLHTGVQNGDWTNPYTLSIQTVLPLPLEWLTFDGSVLGQTIRLNWTTAGEENIREFEVQRSRDGFHFISLGTVHAGTQAYQFLDHDPWTGINYYRIRVWENNGIFTYSDLLSFKVKAKLVLKNVAPNPVLDELVIDLETGHTGPLQISVQNALGQVVDQLTFQGKEGSNQLLINTFTWEAGFYFLVIEQAGAYEVVKVFKK